mgnify:CR=1 FL=1
MYLNSDKFPNSDTFQKEFPNSETSETTHSVNASFKGKMNTQIKNTFTECAF